MQHRQVIFYANSILHYSYLQTKTDDIRSIMRITSVFYFRPKGAQKKVSYVIPEFSKYHSLSICQIKLEN